MIHENSYRPSSTVLELPITSFKKTSKKIVTKQYLLKRIPHPNIFIKDQIFYRNEQMILGSKFLT